MYHPYSPDLTACAALCYACAVLIIGLVPYLSPRDLQVLTNLCLPPSRTHFWAISRRSSG